MTLFEKHCSKTSTWCHVWNLALVTQWLVQLLLNQLVMTVTTLVVCMQCGLEQVC